MLKQVLIGKNKHKRLERGKTMNCNGCNKEINPNDYCICTKCRAKSCPQCAEKNAFVCGACGGDVAYLS